MVALAFRLPGNGWVKPSHAPPEPPRRGAWEVLLACLVVAPTHVGLAVGHPQYVAVVSGSDDVMWHMAGLLVTRRTKKMGDGEIFRLHSDVVCSVRCSCRTLAADSELYRFLAMMPLCGEPVALLGRPCQSLHAWLCMCRRASRRFYRSEPVSHLHVFAHAATASSSGVSVPRGSLVLSTTFPRQVCGVVSLSYLRLLHGNRVLYSLFVETRATELASVLCIC